MLGIVNSAPPKPRSPNTLSDTAALTSGVPLVSFERDQRGAAAEVRPQPQAIADVVGQRVDQRSARTALTAAARAIACSSSSSATSRAARPSRLARPDARREPIAWCRPTRARHLTAQPEDVGRRRNVDRPRRGHIDRRRLPIGRQQRRVHRLWRRERRERRREALFTRRPLRELAHALVHVADAVWSLGPRHLHPRADVTRDFEDRTSRRLPDDRGCPCSATCGRRPTERSP